MPSLPFCSPTSVYLVHSEKEQEKEAESDSLFSRPLSLSPISLSHLSLTLPLSLSHL